MHDMDKLKNLKMLDAGAPDAMKAFWEFDKAVFKDGAISALNKQLIAVAVALKTRPNVNKATDTRAKAVIRVCKPVMTKQPSRMKPSTRIGVDPFCVCVGRRH